MALTTDAFTTNSISAATNTSTKAHVVGTGVERVLFAMAALEFTSAPTSMTVTYNSVSMTLVTSKVSTNHAVFIYKLEAPDEGNHNVVWNWTNNARGSLYNASLFGYGSVGNYDSTSGSGTAPSLTIVSALDEIVFDILSSNSSAATTLTVGADQTQRLNVRVNDSSNYQISGGSTQTGAASSVMSWTINETEAYAYAAYAVRPVSVGGSWMMII